MKQQKGYFRNYEEMIGSGRFIHDVKALAVSHKDERGNVHLKCVCKCGNEFVRTFSCLNMISSAKSCGCKNKKVWSNAGKKNRKFNVNKRKLRDNQNTQYIAGLLAADGYNVSGKTCIGIGLQKGDKELLEKIKEYLEYSGEIKENENSYLLNISDHDFVKFFEERGIIKKKTQNYKVPDRYKINRHFWRGYLDGDGTIHITKAGYLKVSLGAFNKHVVDDFVCFCNSIVPISNTIWSRSERYHIVAVNGAKAEKILKTIYSNSKIYLERKHKKFIEYGRSRRIKKK